MQNNLSLWCGVQGWRSAGEPDIVWVAQMKDELYDHFTAMTEESISACLPTCSPSHTLTHLLVHFNYELVIKLTWLHKAAVPNIKFHSNILWDKYLQTDWKSATRSNFCTESIKMSKSALESLHRCAFSEYYIFIFPNEWCLFEKSCTAQQRWSANYLSAT